MSHQEKQSIFDEYAKSQGYKDWESIIFEFEIHLSNADELNLHIFAACDLVQSKQQRRIAEKVNLHWPYDDKTEWIDKDSIINPENLIK